MRGNVSIMPTRKRGRIARRLTDDHPEGLGNDAVRWGVIQIDEDLGLFGVEAAASLSGFRAREDVPEEIHLESRVRVVGSGDGELG